MEPKIIFSISSEDKLLVERMAREERLTISSFCRYHILNKIKEMKSKQNE